MDVQIINGNFFEDHRGKVVFVNDFDMGPVRRFYYLKHPESHLLRAWQGHKQEQKWFICISGSFTLNYVRPGDWLRPSGQERVESVVLLSDQPRILHIPGGHATGIQSNVPNAILLIYSDMDLEGSKLDDYRFDVSTWAFQSL